MRFSAKLAVISAAVALSLAASPAYAVFGIGDIVLDPTNLVQNTSSALSAVKNEINTAAIYIKSIEQALSLAKSVQSQAGLASMAGVQQELALYQQLRAVSTQLAGTMNQSLQLSQTVTAQYGASNDSWQTFLQSKASVNAATTQSLANQYQAIDASMAQIAERRQSVVNQLQAAGGQTDAMQSVGVGIDTLIGQNQVMIATLRTQGGAALASKTADDAARQATEAAFANYQQRLLNTSAKFHAQSVTP